MSDEIDRVEDPYARRMRLAEEREERKEQRDAVWFERLLERSASDLVRDKAITDQAQAVTTMAHNIANLSRAQEEGQAIHNEHARLAESRERLVSLANASVRPATVIAVVDDGEDCIIVCGGGVRLPIKDSRANVSAALTSR